MMWSTIWPLPRRYVVCLLGLLGITVLHSMRINLSVAVVAMTTYRAEKSENGSVRQVRDFDWDSKDKGLILSSFYYGYLISEIPCAWLGGRFGGATILGLEIALTALFTTLVPFISRYGVYAIFLFRALAGMFEGGTLPVTQCIWSRWAPSEERTILSALMIAGSYTASIICFPLYGYMATYIGWKSLFYAPAIVGCVWCVAWFTNVRNDPSHDTKITDSELNYIRRSVECKYSKRTVYPWKAILTSMPVWANIVAYFTQNWGYVILLNTAPMFLKDVWDFDVKESGLLLMAPYTASALISPTVGLLADYLRSFRGYSTVKVRKLFNVIVGFGGAIFVSLFAISPNPTYGIVFLTLLGCCTPFAFGSNFVNGLDIAPQYANIILAMCCTIGGIASLISPILAGFMVTHQSKFEWMEVYLLCGILYVIGTLFYLKFCSGEIQPWAETNKCEQNEAHMEQIKRSESVHRIDLQSQI